MRNEQNEQVPEREPGSLVYLQRRLEELACDVEHQANCIYDKLQRIERFNLPNENAKSAYPGPVPNAPDYEPDVMTLVNNAVTRLRVAEERLRFFNAHLDALL